MFEFIKNWFKKKPELTITINGESFTTSDEKEISEIIKIFNESLQAQIKKSNQEN